MKKVVVNKNAYLTRLLVIVGAIQKSSFLQPMTRLVLDPEVLPLVCSKASVSNEFRVRLLVQTVSFDGRYLEVCKMRNAPHIHTQIVLDSEESGPETPGRSFILDLLPVLHTFKREASDPGSVVSVVGYYNGKEVNVVECYAVEAQAILEEGRIEVVGKVAKMAGDGVK